jgi:cation diffusion facilitator CzcD-associated flavoprotein CzcO
MPVNEVPSSFGEAAVLDVAVIGAGFAGMYMVHRLKGTGLSFRAFERGDGVGGTWFWNRYPGARCDVPSLQYSYSFSEELEQEWEWSEKYATQPEILAYATYVADRYDLRSHITFDTEIVAVVWDDDAAFWTLTTSAGDAVRARFVVAAVGALSAGKEPDIPGLESFAGLTLFTNRWPKDGVDLTGKTVGVIGTGSSGIQVIPVLAEHAREVTVYQRTAAYTLPAQNEVYDATYLAEYKARYREHRAKARSTRTGLLLERRPEPAMSVDEAERRRRYQECWDAGIFGCTASAFADIVIDIAANETAAEFIRERIRDIVRDPAVAEDLIPRAYPFGTRRVCLDTDYYDTFNRDDVRLVNLRSDPIVEITPQGVRTASAERQHDVLVFATGFDAITGSFTRLGIVGRGGVRLEDVWSEAPRAYLGLQVSGFPNLFTVTGPSSPSILSNVLVSIEEHVDWITELLQHMADSGARTVEADPDAERQWYEEAAALVEGTLYPQADSYFMGTNIPGKPRVFLPYMGGVNVYHDKITQVARDGYTGFLFDVTASSRTAVGAEGR